MAYTCSTNKHKELFLKYLILLAVVIAGAGIPVQVAANHRLEKAVQSPAMATTLAFFIGGLALAALTATGWFGRGNLSEAPNAPWWAWIGGLLSAAAVITSIIGLPIAGAGMVMAATIFGQLTAAVILDHFGWLDVPRIRLNAWRVSGTILLLVGAILMRHK